MYYAPLDVWHILQCVLFIVTLVLCEVLRRKCLSMKCISLIYPNTFTISLLSFTKIFSNVRLSFHVRVKMTRMTVCLSAKERGRRDKSGRYDGWETSSTGLTVSSGLKRKEAFGQMTSFQPAFHIPPSFLATKHIITPLTKYSNSEWAFILTDILQYIQSLFQSSLDPAVYINKRHRNYFLI